MHALSCYVFIILACRYGGYSVLQDQFRKYFQTELEACVVSIRTTSWCLTTGLYVMGGGRCFNLGRGDIFVTR